MNLSSVEGERGIGEYNIGDSSEVGGLPLSAVVLEKLVVLAKVVCCGTGEGTGEVGRPAQIRSTSISAFALRSFCLGCVSCTAHS